MKKLPEILPEGFGIITKKLEDSKNIGKLFEEHYPDVNHHMGWNASTLEYVYTRFEGTTSCISLNEAMKRKIPVYTLDEIYALLGTPSKIGTNNTYSLY